MHLHCRIRCLIRCGKLRLNRRRRWRTRQGDSNDLAHRILAGLSKQGGGITPWSRCRAIGAKPFEHGARCPDAPFRIQDGKSGFFFGFEKPPE